jgi:extracellular elastinolytic metalloproteinase
MRDPRNRDTRNHAFNRVSPAMFEALVLEAPAGIALVDGVNRSTGSAARVVSLEASAEPEIMQNDALLVRRALQHVSDLSTVMGFDAVQTPAFVADPSVARTSSGVAAVHMSQTHRGVPLFHMNRTVVFSRDGRIVDAAGESVGVPEDTDITPKIGAKEALLTAARYVTAPAFEENLTDGYGEPLQLPTVALDEYTDPEVLASFSSPTRATVFDKGPFEETPKVQLVLFYSAPEFHLAWEVMLTFRGFNAQYLVIVRADEAEDDPAILYAANTLVAIRAVQARVYTSRPATDGTDARTLVPCPRLRTDYPLEARPDLAQAFPFDWVGDSVSATLGNSVVAVQGFTASSFSGIAGDESLLFDPVDPLGNEQKITNIFYYCNFMHDFFYMLGFDEKAGNFQQIDVGSTGRGGDPVIARAHPGAVTGTANMATRADGVRANMNMGLLTRAGRHTAFDADVVFHEYTHGVSNRLVGGKLDALALNAPQSRGLGEGWSDYFALSIANFASANERVVLGDWVAANPRGIRSAPYDEHYPNTFAALLNVSFSQDEHRSGEIWCAALMQMTRNFVAALGDKPRAYRLSWQIVFDGFKLTPAQPSFLDARNGILNALCGLGDGNPLTNAELGVCIAAFWRAFAKFGLGLNASCPSAEMIDIVEDTSEPV